MGPQPWASRASADQVVGMERDEMVFAIAAEVKQDGRE